MWAYEKKLQYPVKIANPNPAYAKIVITQLGGPDGELGAATRYLNQRYTMPYKEAKAILSDVGTEESVPSSYQLFSAKRGKISILRSVSLFARVRLMVFL